jgi:hypothetical protein
MEGEPLALTPAQARLRKMVLDSVPSPHQAGLRQSAGRPVRLLCQPGSVPGAADGVACWHGDAVSLDYKRPALGRPQHGRRSQTKQHDWTGGDRRPDRHPNIRQKETRVGNWLTGEQAKERWPLPTARH